MAKVKGGLGKTTLIEDLTKPISFHISPALESPPPFRRGSRENGDMDRVRSDEMPPSFKQVLNAAAKALGEENPRIIIRFGRAQHALLLESGDTVRAVAVAEKEGSCRAVAWGNSSFSPLDPEQVLARMGGLVSAIEAITDETVVRFASLADFYEWLQ